MACVHASSEAHNARFGTTVLCKGEEILCPAAPKSGSKREESGSPTPPTPIVAQYPPNVLSVLHRLAICCTVLSVVPVVHCIDRTNALTACAVSRKPFIFHRITNPIRISSIPCRAGLNEQNHSVGLAYSSKFLHVLRVGRCISKADAGTES